MFRRNLITTEEFTPAILEAKNQKFHKFCIRYIVKDRVCFLLGRPADLFDVLCTLVRDVLVEKMTVGQAVIKMFWCKLLYKNAIISQPRRASEIRQRTMELSKHEPSVFTTQLNVNQ
jgi:hypothetical protein